MRPKTKNQGANDERTAILAHLRWLRTLINSVEVHEMLGELVTWIKYRAERNAARKGGLGRK